MKASHGLGCGASWFDKLTMKRFPHSRSGSEGLRVLQPAADDQTPVARHPSGSKRRTQALI